MFYAGSPDLTPLLVLTGITEALADYTGLDKVSAGVGVYGSASAYALVWELGSRRLKNPGPKTIWSVNREGQRAILTRQAPFGYVGIAVNQFWPVIKNALMDVDFSLTDATSTVLALQVAMDNASHRIAKIIGDIAPVDSGDLRSQIMGVDADELDFLDSDSDSNLEADGTLFL